MDLTDLWQEHKKFILATVGATLLLLVGRGVISANYPVASVRASANRTNANLARAEEVKSGTVGDVRAEVDELRGRLTSLVQEMSFRPDELFVLPPGEPNPTAFCWRRIRDLQQVLVDEAERRDIRVPEKLGLEDAAPTDPEEIRRTLRALNVIQNVVLACIDADVRRIQRIRIEEEARRRASRSPFVQELRVEFEILGGERAVRTVLASLSEDASRLGTPYLSITGPTSLTPVTGNRDQVALRLTVAALTIAADDLEEAEG